MPSHAMSYCSCCHSLWQSLNFCTDQCRSGKAPQGYTLPAFSWFIDQTIGGAVATATHGSSLRHGSLSNQASLQCQPTCIAFCARLMQQPPLHYLEHRLVPCLLRHNMTFNLSITYFSCWCHGHLYFRCCVAPQVTSIQSVLANGTVANFSPQSNKHLWRAMQVRPLLMQPPCKSHT